MSVFSGATSTPAMSSGDRVTPCLHVLSLADSSDSSGVTLAHLLTVNTAALMIQIHFQQ